MIEICLDPPTGQVHTRIDRILSVWMSYFLLYTLRNYPKVLPNSELEPEHAEVLQSLPSRSENQPYFDFFARGGTLGEKAITYTMRCKEILGALSSHGISPFFSFHSQIYLITSESMKKHNVRIPYLSQGILNFG